MRPCRGTAAGDAEGIAAAKRRLANVYSLQQRNYAKAAALCAESLELCRAVGDRQGLSQTHLVLGNLARDQGEAERASAHYRESLLLRKQLEQREDCAQTLEALAVGLGHSGQAGRAVQLVSGSRQLRGAIRAPLTAFEQANQDEVVADWRELLGEGPFNDLWRLGQVLSFEQLTQLALSAGSL